MNVRSIRNKVKNVTDYIIDSESDITCVTEHWLNKQNEIRISGRNEEYPQNTVLSR